MANDLLNVGIVGLNAQRGWAKLAHVPALRALLSDYAIMGVANSRADSAAVAAEVLDIPRAFSNVAELVASPEIDLVTVTVKTPHHHGIVKSALEAGKPVYCEWPLGNGLDEAEDLARLAARAGIPTVIGLQACVAPAIQQLLSLVEEGFVGKVLSTTMVGAGGPWGAVTGAADAYALDHRNGTTLLTISAGQALAALQYVLGELVDVRAIIAQRRDKSRIAETGLECPMTSPDQVLVIGHLESGIPLSLHLRGGMARDVGFSWEIHGTEGDLRLTAPMGQIQLARLSLSGARGSETSLHPIELLPHSASNWPTSPLSGNVARLYAKAAAHFRGRGSAVPDFEHAVKLHRLLAAIEKAEETGRRMTRDPLGQWGAETTRTTV
ncbi:oxidoreductase [Aliidongia dinghuensis]|uniref:Oxidoreductase n=1 Tax=Aliidongia dinghuensis TaxID=1867774 RepID=A0A8J2Z1R7_9PROT|nr:Gfo/Idh/MocA family oxidoreductase [Aliidongia dinghuensis]GGF51109.1 oxidoreductase [Aliidongia dinghuensis]